MVICADVASIDTRFVKVNMLQLRHGVGKSFGMIRQDFLTECITELFPLQATFTAMTHSCAPHIQSSNV